MPTDDGMRESRPTPDPTVLTTEQLLREVNGATSLWEAKLSGLEGVLLEKFNSQDTVNKLVERQRIEQKEDTSSAVDAALAAAKEATGKSELSFTDQLKQLTTTFETAVKGQEVRLGDLTERVGKIENIKLGGKEAVNGLYALVAALAALVIIASFLYANKK